MVAIYEMGTGAASARATIVTTGTSIAVPPLVMMPGGVYYAIITAYAEPGFDFAAPLRPAAPREYVPLVTAPFAP